MRKFLRVVARVSFCCVHTLRSFALFRWEMRAGLDFKSYAAGLSFHTARCGPTGSCMVKLGLALLFGVPPVAS